MPFSEGERSEARAFLSPEWYHHTIMDAAADKNFDKSFFTIVPLVSVAPPQAETEAWHASDPKRYEIRVTDLKAVAMSAKMHTGHTQTCNGLDGKEVDFRNDFRPRAGYLYFDISVRYSAVPGRIRRRI